MNEDRNRGCRAHDKRCTRGTESLETRRGFEACYTIKLIDSSRREIAANYVCPRDSLRISCTLRRRQPISLSSFFSSTFLLLSFYSFISGSTYERRNVRAFNTRQVCAADEIGKARLRFPVFVREITAGARRISISRGTRKLSCYV